MKALIVITDMQDADSGGINVVLKVGIVPQGGETFPRIVFDHRCYFDGSETASNLSSILVDCVKEAVANYSALPENAELNIPDTVTTQNILFVN